MKDDDYDDDGLLGTLETNLSGRSTRNERKIVKSNGSEDSAVIVTNLINQLSSYLLISLISIIHLPSDHNDKVHNVPGVA